MASIRKRNGKYQALVRRNGVGQIWDTNHEWMGTDYA